MDSLSFPLFSITPDPRALGNPYVKRALPDGLTTSPEKKQKEGQEDQGKSEELVKIPDCFGIPSSSWPSFGFSPVLPINPLNLLILQLVDGAPPSLINVR